MNWTEIKEKYPKASRLLINYYDIDDSLIGIRYFVEDYLARNLYDFFDSQEIYVCIEYRYGTASLPRWYWMVKQDNAANEQDSSQTRTEAEEKAFEKAFEILENKLPIK